jgi:hypothetical protein
MLINRIDSGIYNEYKSEIQNKADHCVVIATQLCGSGVSENDIEEIALELMGLLNSSLIKIRSKMDKDDLKNL